MESKEKVIEKNMKILGLTREEAEEVYTYEYNVEHNIPMEDDYTEEERANQKAIMKGFGGAKKTEKEKAEKKKSKGGVVVKNKERKPNETKRNIMEIITQALKDNAYENVNLENVERIVSFELENHHFTLTLTQKREPKEK